LLAKLIVMCDGIGFLLGANTCNGQLFPLLRQTWCMLNDALAGDFQSGKAENDSLEHSSGTGGKIRVVAGC